MVRPRICGIGRDCFEGQRVVHGWSWSGLRMAQMWLIWSPVMSKAHTVMVRPVLVENAAILFDLGDRDVR